MTRDARHALIIQRAICYLLAIAGIVLLWINSAHGAVPALPTLHSTAGGFTPQTAVPDPATLLMLTTGIGIVFVKMRG